MKKEVLLKLLGTGEHEEQFASYIIGLEMARTKEGKIVNPFIQGRKEDFAQFTFTVEEKCTERSEWIWRGGLIVDS